MNLIFELDFLFISNLIFTACVACKNPVRNRQKIKFKNQVQSTRGKFPCQFVLRQKEKRIESTIASNSNHFVYIIGEFTWVFFIQVILESSSLCRWLVVSQKLNYDKKGRRDLANQNLNQYPLIFMCSSSRQHTSCFYKTLPDWNNHVAWCWDAKQLWLR